MPFLRSGFLKRFRHLLVAIFVLPWHVPARCQFPSPDSVDAAHGKAAASSLTRSVAVLHRRLGTLAR